ncbi:hypothetical protein SALBM217S_06998 [Streptomyces griseoloalbus]
MVSTSTFAVPSAATISRVASMPLSSGMRMSIRTTSGASSRTCSTASRPLTASPTTSMSGMALSSTEKPSRTIIWSSAIRTRMVMRHPRPPR